MRCELGFTLIELVTAMSVSAMAALMAAPTVGNWIANAKVRTAAESLQNGLRLAQMEALRRNRQTVFALTDDTPGLSAQPLGNGGKWFSRALPLHSGSITDPSDYIQGQAFPARAVVITGPALICFNSMGWQAVNDSTGLAANCDSAGDVTYTIRGNGQAQRRLNVEVSLAGKVRMCDPDKSLSSGDPDGC